MPDQLQLRGGTTAQHTSFTGASKEVTVDTTKKTAVVHDGSTAGGNPLLREDGSNSALALGSQGTPSLKFTGDTNTGIYSPGADQLAISTGGSGRLFVDANGNVGIGGTATANGRLKINVVSGLNCNIVFSENNTERYLLGQVTGDNAFRLYDLVAGSERLRITSAGLLGVGASSPVFLTDILSGTANTGANVNNPSQLSVTGPNKSLTGGGATVFVNSNSDLAIDTGGSIALSGRNTTSSTNSVVWGVVKGAKENATSINTAGYLAFASQNHSTGALVEAMRIDSQQRVGIGTASPNAVVHAVRTGDSVYFKADSDSISTVYGSASALGTGLLGTFTAHPLSFYANSSERARIDTSGRLLVGTSSTFVSGANLQVAVNGGANTNRTDILCLVRTGGTGSASVEAGRSGWLTFGDTDNFTLTGGIGGYRVDPASYASGLRFAVWNGGGGQPATSAAGLQEAMRINDAGELLVGYTTDNGAYKLQVNSQIFATSATIATSDGRYKENVATLDGCLDLVKALRPVSFDWKPQQDITRTDEDGNEVLVREGHNFPDGTQVGFIAQEVQEVLAEKPWLTSVIKQNVRPAITDKDGNELAPEEEFLGIAEGNLIAVLTSALQEAIGEIESLKARVAALEAN